MIETTDDKVIISREVWEELKKDNYFHELIEIIEDREELKQAEKETTSFVSYNDYRAKRLANQNV